MKIFTKRVLLDRNHEFVVTLEDNILTSTYISTKKAQNISRYTIKLTISLSREEFENCVLDAAYYFSKLRKKHSKRVHSTFIYILIAIISRVTSKPVHGLITEVERETELASQEERKTQIKVKSFETSVYKYKKLIREEENKE
jgi:hypothetical protein